jgi:hypothetical protein
MLGPEHKHQCSIGLLWAAARKHIHDQNKPAKGYERSPAGLLAGSIGWNGPVYGQHVFRVSVDN